MLRRTLFAVALLGWSSVSVACSCPEPEESTPRQIAWTNREIAQRTHVIADVVVLEAMNEAAHRGPLLKPTRIYLGERQQAYRVSMQFWRLGGWAGSNCDQMVKPGERLRVALYKAPRSFLNWRSWFLLEPYWSEGWRDPGMCTTRWLANDVRMQAVLDQARGLGKR